MDVKRLLIGEGGLGVLTGTLLLLGAGAGLIGSAAFGFGDLLARAPAELDCATFALAPAPDRWVALSRCTVRLDARVALPGDAGVTAAVGGGAMRVLLTDAELDAGPVVVRERVVGHLEQQVDGGWLLTPGRPRPSAQASARLLLGMALVVMAVLPMARRWLLARELQRP